VDVSDSERLREGIAAIWKKAQPHVRAQIERLETASAQLTAGTLSGEGRRAAERDAHQLAGAAGSFGFPSATDAGRELELMLASERDMDPARVAELIRHMRTTLITDA
jgi:HPt (histidine-containing phosphotransfer) domain-containing protein